jgi:DNA-binding CsgD family transcriptional regulator
VASIAERILSDRSLEMLRDWAYGDTYSEIAKSHQVSKQRVGQIINSAIKQIRKAIGSLPEGDQWPHTS